MQLRNTAPWLFSLMVSGLLCAESISENVVQTEFAPVDRQGHLHLSRPIVPINSTKDQPELYISFEFSSALGKPSPYLGDNWRFPLLEASCYPVREDLYLVNLVCGRNMFCGKTIYLLKNQKEPEKYQSADKEWSGELKDNIFHIYRKDGSFIEYHDGHIYELRTDQGSVFRWVWRDGRVAEICEGDKKLLTMEEDSATHLIRAMTVNGKKYILNFLPISKEAGSRLTLSSVLWPDTTKEKYQIEEEDIFGRLLVESRDGVQKTYAWNLLTGKIQSDDFYKYTVGKSDGFYENPPITKVSIDGKTSNFYQDTRRGVSSFQAEDGTLTKVYYNLKRGKSYQKPYRIEKIMDGKAEVVFRGEYDAEGRIVTRFENGITVRFEYDKAGQRLEVSREGTYAGVTGEKLLNQEKALLRKIDVSGGVPEKDQALEELGYFYIHDLVDFKKCSEISKRIGSGQKRFNVQAQWVFYNEGLSVEKKKIAYRELLAEFPDQGDLLKNLIDE